MKKFIPLIAFAALATAGLPPAAEAKTSFHLYLGIPHYDYRVGPGYIYRDGYGWYDPGYRYNRPYRFRLSCAEARREVRRDGFRNISTIECMGPTYTFRATWRGNRTVVFVNARTGAVWRGRG
ncbi:MAG: hypothetical protein U1E15_02435 [Hyphomicrobiales bacterium]